MRIRIVSVVALVLAVCGATTAQGETNVFESTVAPAPEGELDRLVFAQFERLNLQPVLCSDAVFVRRVYLDVLGTVPTAQEARDFIQNPDLKNKRRELVDRLLERDEYADYWAMRWGDILRIKAEFPVNLWPNAAQAYHHWVRASLAANKPYDQFARELLTASGSNFRVGPVNFYRALQNRTPEGIARAVALTFMGTRVDSWPTNRLAGFTVFFSQIGYKPTGEWKEEHVFWDPLGSGSVPGNSAPGRPSVAAIGQPPTNTAPASVPVWTNPMPTEGVFPDGTRASISSDRDPREVFADWLIRPENSWFTRNIVNRAWAWLMGRGIIHEPDDIREDNPPSNPALLAYLQHEMVAGHYDLKRLFRLILNSETYQLSSMPRPASPEAAANFASYPVRRLDAEVLIDAINKITGGSDLYTSPIPEPFTYIPKGMPAVAIGDGSITSPSLALFGRSARATGMTNERDNKPTPAQWLYLLNSSDVQRKLEQGTNLQAIIGFGGRKPPQVAQELYLTILSRFPTPEEIKIVESYSRPPPTKTPATTKSAGTNAPSTNAAVAKLDKTNSPATRPAEPARPESATNLVAAPPNNSTNSEPGKTNPPVKSGPLGSLGPSSKSPSRATPPKSREDWMDVAWSLINSEEFLYRH